MSYLKAIVRKIAAERERQDAKWGSDIERIRSAASPIPGMWLPNQQTVKLYEERERLAGRESFLMTALEELCEVADAAEGDRDADGPELEKELIQLAAVVAKWLEAMYRRRDKRAGSDRSAVAPKREAWWVEDWSGEGGTAVWAASAAEAVERAKMLLGYTPELIAAEGEPDLRAKNSKTANTEKLQDLLELATSVAEQAIQESEDQ